MPRARSVTDVMLGEAGGRNARERYHDLLGVASAITNRARALNVSPEDVVSNTKEFNAYGKTLPPGVERYRALAEAALNEVNVVGPIHTGTFYATPSATKNLPSGLTRVAKTTSHVYFDDPQDQPINTGVGSRKISKEAKTRIASDVAMRDATAATENASRLAEQDRAAAIAARSFDAPARTVAFSPSIDATTHSTVDTAKAIAQDTGQARALAKAPSDAVRGATVDPVSISARPTAPSISAANMQPGRFSASSATQANPSAVTAPPASVSATSARSASPASGFAPSAGTGLGGGPKGGGGWGDEDTGGGFFGGLAEKLGFGLSSPIGSGATLNDKAAPSSVSVTAVGEKGAGVGPGVKGSVSVNKAGASTQTERAAGYEAAKQNGWAKALNDQAALGYGNFNSLDGFATPPPERQQFGPKAPPAQTIDNTAKAMQVPTAGATTAINTVSTPSYEVPELATAYSPTKAVSRPSAPSVNGGRTTPTAPAMTKASRDLAAYNASLDADRPGQMQAAAAAARAKTDRKVSAPMNPSGKSFFGGEFGTKAATMAGGLIGSTFAGPIGGVVGALAGNLIGSNISAPPAPARSGSANSLGSPAGGSGGFWGGLFGSTTSGDGLSGSGPSGRGPVGAGGRGPSGSGRAGQSNGGGIGGDRDKGRRN